MSVPNPFDEKAQHAYRYDQGNTIYMNSEHRAMGGAGWQACYQWISKEALEPLIRLAMLAEKVRDAQSDYYSSGGSQTKLRDAKRQEKILDDYIIQLRRQGKLPKKPDPSTQPNLF